MTETTEAGGRPVRAERADTMLTEGEMRLLDAVKDAYAVSRSAALRMLMLGSLTGREAGIDERTAFAVRQAHRALGKGSGE